jgi:hypothetical protein
MVPPQHVLEFFGADGKPALMAGGTGRSWRVGSIVVKPVASSAEEIAWQAQLLGSVKQDGFRLAPPKPDVCDGWAAFDWVPGEHQPGRWPEIIDVGGRFHNALASVPKPHAILDPREDAWAIGDRVAWGETPFPEADDILSALVPVEDPSQLVHGDLTGNVLFHPDLPPAIIDFAPYWRPAEFAAAIVVADAIVWEGAPEAFAKVVGRQYLLRALVFRGVAARIMGFDRAIPELDLARRVVATVA